MGVVAAIVLRRIRTKLNYEGKEVTFLAYVNPSIFQYHFHFFIPKRPSCPMLLCDNGGVGAKVTKEYIRRMEE